MFPLVRVINCKNGLIDTSGFRLWFKPTTDWIIWSPLTFIYKSQQLFFSLHKLQWLWQQFNWLGCSQWPTGSLAKFISCLQKSLDLMDLFTPSLRLPSPLKPISFVSCHAWGTAEFLLGRQEKTERRNLVAGSVAPCLIRINMKNMSQSGGGASGLMPLRIPWVFSRRLLTNHQKPPSLWSHYGCITSSSCMLWHSTTQGYKERKTCMSWTRTHVVEWAH